MNNYSITVETISGYECTYVVSYHRKPLIHEAWAWLEKINGERSCYLQANTVRVKEFNIEPFEV